MKKILAVILLLIAAVSFAAGPRPAFVDNIRALGLGGTYIALANDSGAQMYNPAGIAKGPAFHIDLLALEMETSQKTVDFIQYFIDNSKLFDGKINSWNATTIDKLTNAGIKLVVADHFSVVGINTPAGNLAFGAYGVVFANISTQYDILNINAKIEADMDAILPITYAGMVDFGLNGILDSFLAGTRLGAGITGKIIQRYHLSETRSAFELSGLQPDKIIAKVKNPLTGYGFDVGANLYMPALGSTFSFVGQDVMTRIGASAVDARWNLGYAFTLLPGITAAVDVYDVFGNLTILNKLHMGAEADLLAGLITIRGGFYQGWPAFGIDLLGFLKYANYGVEVGAYAGQIEERQHRIAICLGL
ncbi:MAG: hypothetical protein WCI43_08370 [Candidatus Firestonebacteria bacterium]